MIDSLNHLDQRLFLFFNSFNTPFLNSPMSFISGQIIWVPLVFYICFLAYKQFGKKNILIFILFALMVIVASDVTASSIIKKLFNRMRPCREIGLSELINDFGQRCGGKYGFVSSHAANSFGLIIFAISTLKLSKKSVAIFLMIPILISYSRIYLGVHYPGDILGGLIVAIIWGWCFSSMFKSYLGRKST